MSIKTVDDATGQIIEEGRAFIVYRPGMEDQGLHFVNIEDVVKHMYKYLREDPQGYVSITTVNYVKKQESE